MRPQQSPQGTEAPWPPCHARTRSPRRTVAGVSPVDLPNGRDLGGIATRHGTVRSGLVFRSAAPTGDAARLALADLGIRTVVDLRSALEREQQPTDLPPTADARAADVLADASYAGAANLGKLAAEALSGRQVAGEFAGRDLRAIMLESYRDFVELGSGMAATRDVLRLLAEPGTGPLLFHCTAGKDRTGWLAAILLHILGAGWEDITNDYLRSGPEVHAMFAGFLARLPDQDGVGHLLEPVIGVSPDYLQAARETAERTHGSLDDYVRDGLGIDDATVAALRARLTGPR